MSDHQFEPAPAVARTSHLNRAEEAHAPLIPAVQREQVNQPASRTRDGSTAAAHAALISRATAAKPERVAHSFLQLQRQYGNRYVEQLVARARQDAESNAVHPAVERTIHEQRGGGQHLDSAVKGQMETSMGADFSRVKVHTGATADTLNHALSARAFTTGNDIFFREGAYQPGSFVGRELLAHELTHVVQQNGSQVSRQMSVSQPGDAHEMEAEQTAHAVMHRELHQGGTDAAGISRQDDAMASRCCDDAQRQPEALHHEDDEKKKHHLAKSGEASELARAGEEQME